MDFGDTFICLVMADMSSEFCVVVRLVFSGWLKIFEESNSMVPSHHPGAQALMIENRMYSLTQSGINGSIQPPES